MNTSSVEFVDIPNNEFDEFPTTILPSSFTVIVKVTSPIGLYPSGWLVSVIVTVYVPGFMFSFFALSIFVVPSDLVVNESLKPGNPLQLTVNPTLARGELLSASNFNICSSMSFFFIFSIWICITEFTISTLNPSSSRSSVISHPFSSVYSTVNVISSISSGSYPFGGSISFTVISNFVPVIFSSINDRFISPFSSRTFGSNVLPLIVISNFPPFPPILTPSWSTFIIFIGGISYLFVSTNCNSTSPFSFTSPEFQSGSSVTSFPSSIKIASNV